MTFFAQAKLARAIWRWSWVYCVARTAMVRWTAVEWRLNPDRLTHRPIRRLRLRA